MVWELIAPSRQLIWPRWRRWPGNVALAFCGAALQRFFLPLGAVSTALYIQKLGFGLLTQLQLPPLMESVLVIVVLDLAIYWQHRVTHVLPWLWRLHSVHHADQDVDGTTALRFHPFEIALSLVWKSLVIILLGASPESVLLFEILLNSLAIFNHANARLPVRLERFLRFFIVTPNMHRVHHSIDGQDQLHNFGFNLTIWDRLFGSHRESSAFESRSDSESNPFSPSFPLGVEDWQNDVRTISLGWLLRMPFLRQD